MTLLKIQSAMEYLMTYGWAILIIAVVLSAFFGLGFFNPNTLAPKVSPGSCNVYRPNGPGSTSLINLVGTCNNGLPKYAAQFNGASSIVAIPNTGTLNGMSGTGVISVWVRTSSPAADQVAFSTWDNTPDGFGVRIQAGDPAIIANGATSVASATAINNGNWHNLIGVWTGSNSLALLYVDGKLANTGSMTFSASGLDNVIGAWCTGANGTSCAQNFNGMISNLQVYNTSFSSNDVTTLYDEGIGGAPIALQWLVGWWPLNGDANDYSGNGNNGAASNVIYTTGWANGYAAP